MPIILMKVCDGHGLTPFAHHLNEGLRWARANALCPSYSCLDALTAYPQGDLAQFRKVDLAAAVSRMRSLQVR